MVKCKSCGCEMLYVLNRKTGNTIPLDMSRTVYIMANENDPSTGLPIVDTKRSAGVSHFTTCPHATAHSKKGKK